MVPSPAELQYFVEIAGTLNISRAAERLGISQPSLSLAVKRLEDALGVTLLIRSKSGVTLTRAGTRFVVRARILLHEWDRLTDEAVREESELSGRYVIGCHPSVALYALPQVIPGLLVEHPGLEIRLAHGLSRQITDDVIGFKVDFAVVINPVEHPDLVIKMLEKDEVTLWHSPDHDALLKAERGDGVLVCDPDLSQSQGVIKQLAKRGWGFRRTVVTSSLEVAVAMTAKGAGVGILPGRVAQRDKSLKLKALPGAPKMADRVCLIYRADAQKSAASKLIIQSLAQCLK